MSNLFARICRWGLNQFRSREFAVAERFTRVYQENLFGAEESRSGEGSTLAQTAVIRERLPALLDRHGVHTLLDAPCGDGHWISCLDWSRRRYHGVDVVAALVRANQERFAGRNMMFSAADLCTSELPAADLILCRDCWVHLTYRQIGDMMRNFRRSGAGWLLTTTFPAHARNRDLRAGLIWRPLNLERAPFHFPPARESIVEGCTEQGRRYSDKALALWRIEDLPA